MSSLGRVASLIDPIVRPCLKDRICVYNGVAVRDLPMHVSSDHYDGHKEALCDAVQSIVEPGDDVVIVGGGRGVAATWAARAGATVTVYEAAREMVDILHETQRLNEVTFDVRHAIVGGEYDVYGSADGATHVAPETLRGDVLVCDCEGAEMDILPAAGGGEFDAVVVETHPAFGAPTAAVRDVLGGGEIVAPDPVDGDVVVRTW